MKKKVFELAAEIVRRPGPSYGYGDIGDVLIEYMQRRSSSKEAAKKLRLVAVDCENTRQRETANIGK